MFFVLKIKSKLKTQKCSSIKLLFYVLTACLTALLTARTARLTARTARLTAQTARLTARTAEPATVGSGRVN